MGLLERLRGEGASVRHKFRTRPHKNRPDVIEHIHDVENCDLCRLLDVAEAAREFRRVVQSIRPLPKSVEQLLAYLKLTDALARLDAAATERDT